MSNFVAWFEFENLIPPFNELPEVLQRKIVNIAVDLDLEIDNVFEYLKQNDTKSINKLRGKPFKILRQKIQSK